MFVEIITYDVVLSGLYVLAAFLYCTFLIIVSRLEYYYKKKKFPLTDDACLERLAKMYGLSEYTVFLEAGKNWNISEKNANSGFKTYLKSGVMPYYVRDFVRQHKHEVENCAPPNLPYKNSHPPTCSG
jgi:hypothetical protein